MPPKPSDVLDQARSLIEDRLKELDDERRRLERTLSDITGGRVGRRRPGRPRGSTTARRTTARRRGRRRTTRADQALKHVQANPEITASEVARKMRIKPNYVYRVMGDLQKQGKVRKRGKGYVAA
jgi:sugar-specific transcriptional regulator TrmB